MPQRFKNLIAENFIEAYRALPEEVEDLFNVAKRDIETALKVRDIDWDWAFAIAYNSVLQAGRAYIFSRGYRVKAHLAHKTVFVFLKLDLHEKENEIIEYFDRIRRKRHTAVYENAEIISEKELTQLLSRAKEFVKYLYSRTELKKL